MKIRRRSAEASEAKNTFVGLCLTWNVEVGIKMVNLDHSGGEVQHCSQMDRIRVAPNTSILWYSRIVGTE